MKFLLVALNAKYIHSNPALYSMKAYVGEELSKYVELGEYTINNDFIDILADIYKRKPDVIGFSCYIWNIDMIFQLVVELSKLLPDTHIWLGGPEVSYNAMDLIEQYSAVKGVIIGEGEETFKELLECYVSHDVTKDRCAISEVENSKIDIKLQQLSGLCLKTGYTSPRELIDMDKLPFLYGDLSTFENRIIYYESSRGCPYSCSYCLSSIDKKTRFRDIEIVKKELQFFLDNKVKQVKFVDRTFNCNHKHAMEVWCYIWEHDNGVTNFHFEISADILNDEEIEVLGRMRPGLVQLEIGVQSTNVETLKAINRHMDVDRLESIVAAVRRGNNVHQHLDLIAGLPYEDYESFGRSFDRVYAMKPEQLQLGFLKVLKGSEMFNKAGEYGICYTDKAPYEVLYTKWLSFDDVLKLKQIEEMVEIYYNSNQFVHTLNVLEKCFESPFVMYEALAGFYEDKGYFTNSPARSYRYDVLLDFATSYDFANKELYKELLTYDMYLREKLKTRPKFARDLKDYRDKIIELYKLEEKERQYLPEYNDFDSKQLERMTHMEVFFYPVWDMEKMLKCRIETKAVIEGNFENQYSKKAIYVLFDYRSRKQLTWEANTIVVEI